MTGTPYDMLKGTGYIWQRISLPADICWVSRGGVFSVYRIAEQDFKSWSEVGCKNPAKCSHVVVIHVVQSSKVNNRIHRHVFSYEKENGLFLDRNNAKQLDFAYISI